MTNATRDAKRCLALEFKPLIPDTGFGGDAKEAVYRFASVTLVARFDPGCMREMCLDRQTVLLDAEVLAVTTRRKSRLGLWLGKQEPLTPMAGADADAIIAAARDAGYPGPTPNADLPEAAAFDAETGPRLRAFAVPGNADGAVVCWAPGVMGSDIWPQSYQSAVIAPSVNDYYHCNVVRRIDGRWVVQV
jgi:hypothetical protein